MPFSFNTNGSNASNASRGFFSRGFMRQSPSLSSQQNQPVQTPGTTNTQTQTGLLDQHRPTTEVRSMTDAQGNRVDFHPPSTTGGSAGSSTGTTTPRQKNIVQPNAEQQGNQYFREAETTPELDYYKRMAIKANEAQNVGRLAPYAESQFYGQGGQAGGALPDLTLPDLVGRGSANQGLFGALGNIYGSTAQTGISNALADRAQRLGVQSDVFNKSIPSQISGSSRLYNPLAGIGNNGGTNGIIQGAQNQFTYDTTARYLQGQQNLQAADAIQNQIIGTLQSNPTLNSQPLSSITNLNQLLSGQVSSGPQQLLSQQIHQYITTLGLDPATVTDIAHQQQGTLAQLLDSLRQTAQNLNEANNPNNINSGGSPSGSNGGGLYDF